jgi:hypothetical protein
VVVPRFDDVTAARGLSTELPTDQGTSHAEGAAWGDVDGDGYPDLYVPIRDQPAQLWIYDPGLGTYTDRSADWQVTNPGGVGVSATFVDVDEGDRFYVLTNAWLGSAPKRAFDPERFFRWRNYWDYASGIASDLFVHRVTRIIKSLDLTFPAFGTGSGGKFQFTQSKNEIPDTLNMLLDYPGGLTVQLISSMANERRVDHLLRGHKATLQFTNTGFSIRPERQYANEPKWKETPEIVHQKSGAEALGLHHRNLVNAIRKNEALKCDAMLGYYGVVAVQMGNLSYRRRKYMKWDSARQRIVAA